MKLYIHQASYFRSDKEDLEIKKELKTRYKLDTRRQDAFIHLAVLGAQRLKEKTTLYADDELYITSLLGNTEVLQKTYEYVCKKGDFIRPYDFINMLGNTTSYYVASSLGVKDKNFYQISDNFTFINTLISIYASLASSTKRAILGSVDLVSKPSEISKRLLGMKEDVSLFSSCGYQLLSTQAEGAIAEIDFSTKIYNQEEIELFLKTNKKKVMQAQEYEKTLISSIINENIALKNNLIYIDSYDRKYKILELNLLIK